jgi:hypothetical protein
VARRPTVSSSVITNNGRSGKSASGATGQKAVLARVTLPMWAERFPFPPSPHLMKGGKVPPLSSLAKQKAAGSISGGLTGLKIHWFETQPSPGIVRLFLVGWPVESRIQFR